MSSEIKQADNIDIVNTNKNDTIPFAKITTINDLIKYLDKDKFKESLKKLLEDSNITYRPDINDNLKQILFEFVDNIVSYDTDEFLSTISNLLLCDNNDNASVFFNILENNINDKKQHMLYREYIAISIVMAMSDNCNYIGSDIVEHQKSYLNIISKLYNINEYKDKPTNNKNVTFYYLKKSYELGNISAMTKFAVLYRNKNREECFQYFRNKADNNDIDATLMYAKLQVVNDLNEAQLYFLKAAELGSAHRMFKYARMIQHANLEEAIKYYKMANLCYAK